MSEGSTAAPRPLELTQDEKAYAGLAHALMISTWWIGPLVIFLTKRSSRFVSFHALQALFWQIIFTLLHVCRHASDVQCDVRHHSEHAEGQNGRAAISNWIFPSIA